MYKVVTYSPEMYPVATDGPYRTMADAERAADRRRDYCERKGWSYTVRTEKG
jgi:hypothetical protein